MIRVLDLFSCIGFHSLGLERASPDFKIVALCEANERRRQELERLHPGVPIYDDVRTLPVIEADVVFGGPPCQRTSVAAAIHGKRDGHSLWPYMLCAGIDAGAEWIVVEQPPGNAAWEAQVYRHLSRAGYHVARFVFGAEDVGAPYPRRRVYLIACTSLPRLEIAWQAGPSAIERAKGAADARGDWDPDAIPTFDMDTWRADDVLERREAIEALGDSNPPAMAEVIGYMISDAMAGGAGFEPALPFGRTEYRSAAFNHSATPVDPQEMAGAADLCKTPPPQSNVKGD
ncbi:DNA cytosine methyltransferase [Pseudorhizobium tarimense]|uniref:DNA cytosine methyltransferase n=1 Tax=Pseudorhizobium tarimense TaxID=1079109 RepID=UPI001FF1A7C5|nr:DNA cytosine methyltransferase [Pseudorhizobium tarimense]MCJ8517786.1 DNA cytosine methyltransferase [Pseudorhizobium tarimense]